MKQFLRNAILIFAIFPQKAICGAWLSPINTGQIITSVYVPKSDSALLNEANFYGEYGISKRQSLVLSASHLQYHDANSGYVSSIGIKQDVYSKNKLVISAQINAHRNKIDIFHEAQTKYEARILFGKNFKNGVWLNCEMGLKVPKDNETFGYELALGKNLPKGGNIIAKYLRDDFAVSKSVEKVQISYIRQLNNNWYFESGIRHDFSGYDGKENNGIILGVWFKF